MSDFNTQLETEHKLHQKALVWLTTKMLNDERVKITQLASSLRVTVEKAKDVVKFITRHLSDKDRNTKLLSIFVQDNKFPDWLNEHYPASIIVQALMYAKNTNVTTLNRDLHRKALADKYGTRFQKYLRAQYRRNELTTFEAIEALGIDVRPKVKSTYPQLCQLADPDWAIRMGYNVGIHELHQLDGGTEVRLSFGSVPNHVVKRLPTLCELKLLGVVRDPVKQVVQDKYLALLQELVERMQAANFKVSRITRLGAVNSNNVRPMIIFVKDNDLRATVTITLPWTDVQPIGIV